MSIRKCYVDTCQSSTDREQDRRVTFHKLPKNPLLKAKWLMQARFGQQVDKKWCFICSRHFRKVDFEPYKASKFVLKSDAIPTIFSWGVTPLEELDKIFSTIDVSKVLSESLSSSKKDKKEENCKMDDSDSLKLTDNKIDVSVNNILKENDTNCVGNNVENVNMETCNKIVTDTEQFESFLKQSQEFNCSDSKKDVSDKSAPSISELGSDCNKDVASTPPQSNGIIDSVIHDDKTENNSMQNQSSTLPEIERIFENLFEKDKNDGQTMVEKKSLDNSKEGDNALAAEAEKPENKEAPAVSPLKPLPKQPMLMPGYRVEAKDFNDMWYPAKVVEVDHDEDEVLIHYDNWSTRFDEWISIDSPRLRLIQGPPPVASTIPTYNVGERCFARWSNNQRFPATVHKVLQNGKYEVVFDDGFKRTLKWIMMSKGNNRRVSAGASPSTVECSPLSPEVKSEPESFTPGSIQHSQNHLFDPKLDHLGTKEERRSMKKKIDVKSLFTRKKKTLELDKSAETPEAIDKLKKKKPKISEEVETKLVDKIKKKSGPSKGITKKKKVDSNTTSADTSEADLNNSALSVNSIIENIASPEAIDGDLPKNITIEDVNKSSDVISNALSPPQNNVVQSNNMKQLTSPKHRNSIHSPPLCPVPSSEPKETQNPQSELKKVLNSAIVKQPQLSTASIIATTTTTTTTCVSSPSQSGTTLLTEMLRDNSKSVVKNIEPSISKLVSPPNNVKINTLAPKMPLDPNSLRAAEKDWCCYWVNGQPVGTVLDLKPSTKELSVNRITVQVEDPRLPPDWTKLLTRKTVGSAEGKWDVVLVCPSGQRYRTRGEMMERLRRDYDQLAPYGLGLMDFSAHRKQARRRGWDVTLPTPAPLPINDQNHQGDTKINNGQLIGNDLSVSSNVPNRDFVYIGSLKVQIIENLLRCPKEGCFKNFRRENLLQMHIKHYHPEMCKFFGDTPNVADLAYARTVVEEPPTPPAKPKSDLDKSSSKSKDKRQSAPFDNVPIKVEQVDFDNYFYTNSQDHSMFTGANEMRPNDVKFDEGFVSVKEEIVSSEDIKPDNIGEEYQMFGQWNVNKQKFNKPHTFTFQSQIKNFTHYKKPTNVKSDFSNSQLSKMYSDSEEDGVFRKEVAPPRNYSNFECAQSFAGNLKKTSKKRPIDGQDENRSKKKKLHSYNSWNYFAPELDETRSSFGINDKNGELANSFNSIGDNKNDIVKMEKDNNQSMIVTETGEKIKIVHMKREEIINCRCGFGEEDGLMIQCELCLCWQHAICHQIEKESEVPEKYICNICLNPPRGRSSQKYLHDQDWLYEGKLPRASPTPLPIDATRSNLLRKSHELAANLLQLRDLMHSLRCKIEVAEKKDHPKLYYWSKPWDDIPLDIKDVKPLKSEIENIKTKENKSEDNKLEQNCGEIKSELGEINTEMVQSIINENNLVKEEELKNHQMDDILKDSKCELANGTNLFGNLLSSPGGTTIDLPITNLEIEALTKAVNMVAPQPEAAIEPAECRLRLLQHVERTQLLLEARLDSIEAQIAELEAQDVLLEDDETPDHYPRTKQTIQMLLRDLTTMEELGLS